MPITNGQANNNGGGGGGGGNINYVYKGVYNAATNTPPLANGTGSVGWWYLTTAEGTNNPTGQLLKVNQIIAYNGAIWQGGGQIDNSDEIIIAPDYIVIRGQTIQVGQSLTVALGILEGEIADLSQNIATALNGKQNLVVGATNDDLATLDANGQVKDSGIQKSAITSLQTEVTNLEQTKANLVASPTNGDILTTNAQGQPLDSGVKLTDVTTQLNVNTQNISSLGQTVNQQGTSIGNLQNDVSQNTQDIAKNTQDITKNTQDISTINETLNTKQNTVPGATNGNLASLVNGQTVDSQIAKDDVITKENIEANAVVSVGKDTPVKGVIVFTGAGITQNGNTFNIPAAADGGATELVVQSPDGTIEQVGTSTYDAQNRRINIQLKAIGDGTGTVTKVSSANADIGVTNETTTPVLTLNSTVDGSSVNASKIVKLDTNGNMGDINVGLNARAFNPKTLQLTTVNQALQDAFASTPDIVIANTVFVGKNGTIAGTGAINNLYPTIQAAIDASPANTQIFVYASGLATASAYAENLILKASQVITGASSQFVVISGTITTPTTGGTCYLENLRIQTPATAGNVSTVNIDGGANVTNLQLHNVDINLYGGTGSCVNWTNTNANSRFVTDGTSAWNVISSTNGAKLFTSAAGTAGLVILQNVSAQLIDNTNRVAYSIGGAIRFYHTLDNIYGQVVVSNTAAFFGTFLTINTGNIAALVTNSTSFSTLNSCVMTTTANAVANTAVVEGAGAFAFYQTSTPNTTVKGYATTLNGGIGAIAAATYSIRLDSSGIAPFTAGTSDGLIQYDGSNYFVDTLTARSKLVTADNNTNKILGSWLPNTEYINGVDIPLSAPLLPLNGLRTVTNSSATTTINITLPANYVYTSTAYGNSTTSLALLPKSSVTLMCTAVNTAPTNSNVAIIGFAVASGGGTPYTLPVATATVLGGVKILANSGLVIDANGNLSPNYNLVPTFANKKQSDVISSNAFYNAVSTIAGTNLTYNPATGKLNAVSTPSGDRGSAQYSNFASGSLISSGKVNIGSATARSVTNMADATGVELPLLPNAVFDVMAILNINCANQPSHGTTDLQYTGTVDAPPTYAISTANCQIANGSIINGVFYGNGYNGSIVNNAFTSTGLITEYATTANVTSELCAVGASTSATAWTLYAPIALSVDATPKSFTTSLLYENGAGTLSLNPTVTLAQTGDNKLGAGSSAWSNFVNPIAPSGTYFNSGSVVTDKYTVLYGVGNVTTVWTASNSTNTPTWTQSPAFTAMSSGYDSCAIFNDTFVSLSLSTAATPHAGVAINLASNTIIGEFTTTNTKPVMQISTGALGSGNVFVFVSSDWSTIRWANVNTPTAWNDVATNISTVVPAVLALSGICYNPIEGAWFVVAIDGTNTYILTSTDLSTWSLFQTINNLLFSTVKFNKTIGIGVDPLAYSMVMCSYNTSGVGNTVTYSMYLGSGQFRQVTGAMNPSGVQVHTHPCGLFVLSTTTATDKFNYSYDGITFFEAPANGNARGIMIPVGNGFIRINAGFAWGYIPTTFRYASTGTQPAFPANIWAWNKTLEVNNTSLFIQNYNLEKNGTISLSATIGYSDTGFNQFSIAVRGIYLNEHVNSFGAVINTDTNTFTVKLTGTNATVPASLTQRPTRAGDDKIILSGKCNTGATSPSVAIEVIFNDGTNSILSNSTITAYQV